MGTRTDLAALLDLWEAVADAPAAAKGALLITHRGHVHDLDEALDLPLGSCTAWVVDEYVHCFGRQLDVVFGCPGCGEQLEADLDLLAATTDLDCLAERELVHTTVGELTVRAPTSRDLLEIAYAADPIHGLLDRCVSYPDGSPVASRHLDPVGVAAVDAAAERVSGAAAVVLGAECPHCGAGVVADLDPVALWSQRIEEATTRGLMQVSVLAAAFGWSEQDILSLSPRRREAYLAMVQA